MFADLGVDPDNSVLVEKCLDTIRTLKLEAEILTGKFREKFTDDVLIMRAAEEEERKALGAITKIEGVNEDQMNSEAMEKM